MRVLHLPSVTPMAFVLPIVQPDHRRQYAISDHPPRALLAPRAMSETLRRRSALPSSHSPATRRTSRRINVISAAALDEQAQADKPSFLSGPRGPIAVILLHLATATVFLHIAEGWALLDALYFAVVIATTVGYGDIAPARPASKVFVALYAVISVSLIAGLLQALVERVADAQGKFTNSAAERLLTSTTMTKDDDEGHDELVVAARVAVRQAKARLRATFFMLLGACLSGALLYGRFINGGYIDLFYFLCVSMTTVGLGDIHPVSKLGKAYAAVWLVLTCLGFASILSQYADLRVKERQRDMVERMLEGDIGDRMFREIDDDGSGALTEAEFLGYMMCKLGKASPDDVSDCDVDRCVFLRYDPARYSDNIISLYTLLVSPCHCALKLNVGRRRFEAFYVDFMSLMPTVLASLPRQK